VNQQLELALKSLEDKAGDPQKQLEDFGRHRQNAGYIIGKNEKLAQLLAAFEARFKPLEADAQKRLEQKIKELAEKERQAKEKFEKGLTSEQNAIYTEWGRKYPDAIKQTKEGNLWVFVKPESKESEVDIHNIYLFSSEGKLLRKDIQKLGGGEVSGYQTLTYWCRLAEVTRDGKIYGYRTETSWARIAEIEKDGSVSGYRSETSWGQIGEIRPDGDIMGYITETSWGKIAECTDGKNVFGYRDATTWTKIAEIEEEGEVYGYVGHSWCKIAEMKLGTPQYRMAVLLFVLYRR
jgi:hypothetical protein